MPRPAHHTRHSDAAFETGPLAFAERPGTAAVFAIAQPGAVVGGEDHQRVLLQTALLQGLEHLAHRPVDFFDNIPIEPLPGTSGKTRSGKDRNVRHGMRQIEEEGRPGTALDERDRPLRVASGQLGLIGSFLDHPIPIDQRQRRVRPLGGIGVLGPHIVGIRQTEILIKSLSGRQQLRRATQMPFADDGGGVSARFKHLGKGHLLRIQSGFRIGAQRSVDAETVGITSGQEGSPRSRTNGLRHIERSETGSVPGDAVDVRCADLLCPEATHVTPPQIIAVNEDHVGEALFLRQPRRCPSTDRDPEREPESGNHAAIFPKPHRHGKRQ